MSLKHSFVSHDCCSNLKAVWVTGKTFLLFGLKVVANASLSLSLSLSLIHIYIYIYIYDKGEN